MNEGSRGKLLTVQQVAERLNLKPVTVRFWIARRELSAIHLGKRALRIPESEIEKLVERGFVPARPEQ